MEFLHGVADIEGGKVPRVSVCCVRAVCHCDGVSEPCPQNSRLAVAVAEHMDGSDSQSLRIDQRARPIRTWRPAGGNSVSTQNKTFHLPQHPGIVSSFRQGDGCRNWVTWMRNRWPKWIPRIKPTLIRERMQLCGNACLPTAISEFVKQVGCSSLGPESGTAALLSTAFSKAWLVLSTWRRLWHTLLEMLRRILRIKCIKFITVKEKETSQWRRRSVQVHRLLFSWTEREVSVPMWRTKKITLTAR